jgi:16S rRNA (guanine1516-N2)-methyltransferase
VSAASVAVDVASFEDVDAARALCARTGLPAGGSEPVDFFLRRRDDGMVLERADGSASLQVDFLSPTFRRRLSTANRSQPLPRSVGLPKVRPSVLDATAGLCKDAFALAHLGCAVTAVERSPALFALVADAHTRALEDRSLSESAGRLTIALGDARAWLAERDRFDVVYLDPMYPRRSKAALGKLELRLVAELVGDEDDEDAGELGRLALVAAKHRVVIKRPLSAEPLLGEPHHAHLGKMARYDVYLVDHGKRA